MTKLVTTKLLFYLFFSSSLLVLKGQAQITRPVREPSTTRNLKDTYLYVKEKVRRNQFYMNEFIVNTHSLTWRDKLLIHSTYIFYYSFLGDDTPLLRFAVLIKKEGEIKTHTEFMYDQDGHLGYCIENQNDTARAYKELHVFYEKERCINVIANKEVIHVKDTTPYQTHIARLQAVGKEVYKKFFADQAY